LAALAILVVAPASAAQAFLMEHSLPLLDRLLSQGASAAELVAGAALRWESWALKVHPQLGPAEPFLCVSETEESIVAR